jgi:hypothetical protein
MMLLYHITLASEPSYAQQALDLAKSQIDYILGNNEFKRSFIHGFGANSWDKVHHRNLQGIDDNPADAIKESTPFKFKRGGALIGGPSEQGQFENSVVHYNTTESGCDYNAGITGALAGLISITAPYEPIAAAKPGTVSTRSPASEISVTLLKKGHRSSLAIGGIGHNRDAALDLYTARGERVARTRTRSANSIAAWNLPDLAAGVYRCSVKCAERSTTVAIAVP